MIGRLGELVALESWLTLMWNSEAKERQRRVCGVYKHRRFGRSNRVWHCSISGKREGFCPLAPKDGRDWCPPLSQDNSRLMVDWLGQSSVELQRKLDVWSGATSLVSVEKGKGKMGSLSIADEVEEGSRSRNGDEVKEIERSHSKGEG